MFASATFFTVVFEQVPSDTTFGRVTWAVAGVIVADLGVAGGITIAIGLVIVALACGGA